MSRTCRLRPVLCSMAVTALLVLASAARPATAPRAMATTSQTLRLWYGSDDPTERAWVQGLVRRFEAAHPTIRVQFSFYSLDDMNTKTQLALSTSAAPDLIYSTPRGPGLPAYVRARRLRDLSADARRRNWAAQLRPGLLAAYNATLAANGTAHDAGKVFAAPYLLAAVGVLYNKAIFRALHLAIPRTAAQFAALLPVLKRAGYTPIGFGDEDGWVGDAWYLTLVNALAGPEALRPALRGAPSFRFTTPPFQQAAATLQAWAKAGYFSKDLGGLDPQESIQDFFEEGRTAMQLVSSTENAQILAEARQEDSRAKEVGLFAFPGARAGQAPVMLQDGYGGWAIPIAAKDPAAALTFIDDALSAQTAATLLAQGLLPARRIDRGSATAAPFQRDALAARAGATPGVYVDAAPVPNLLATMEASLQRLLAGQETPAALTRVLQAVYSTQGRSAAVGDTDGEF